MAQFYKLLKGSSAYYIIMGIFVIYLVWLGTKILNMELISSILGQILGVGVIALVVVFQQEIRRFLLYLGNKYFVKGVAFASNNSNISYLDELVSACSSMSDTLTGALIVIEQGTDLSFVHETGDEINANVNQRLIENIFFKNSPLHDGAMIIHNNRISHARCVLPTTENKTVPAYYGMRHRAALGVSEASDAIIVVVSEQTGKISFVMGGKIERGISSIQLRELLIKNVH